MAFFSTEDLDNFSDEFGDDIPVKLDGILVTIIQGIQRYEVISESPHQAEIGSSVLTLQIRVSVYNALDRSKKYKFTVDGVEYVSRGPAPQDGSGFVKLLLTKA